MRSSSVAIALLAAPMLLNAQTLQEFSPAPRGRSSLVVFASGNAKSVIAQPKDATSATGSLGMTFMGDHFVVSGVVNVPAKRDTISSNHGASLLAPAAGSTTSALLDVRWPTALRFRGCRGLRAYLCKVGLHGYVAASGARWGSNLDTNGNPRAIDEMSMWATGLGGSYLFFDGWLGRANSEDGNRAAMSLDVLYAARTLRGNLGMAADSAKRNAILGTRARAFGGAELGLNIRYNEANAALTYYHMGGSIKGFSGGQVVAGISFRTKLNGGSFSDLHRD
jgi:hypothetical protein